MIAGGLGEAFDPHMPRTGDVVLGKYRVLDVIDVGGQAVVFDVQHVEHAQRYAAKLINPLNSMRPLHRTRFERERARLAQLHCPSTIRLIDAGTTDEGHLTLILQRAPGQNLQRLIEARAKASGGRTPCFSDAEVRAVAVAVLRSLSEAHGLGIVHRDIKPGNIMYDDVGTTPAVYLLDLGYAIDPDDNDRVTVSFEVPCTASYLAPERYARQGDLPASDLYALGLTLLEMIDGKPPWTEGGPRNVALLHADLDRPVPLSDAVKASAFGAVIARAVAKSLDVRYSEATAMLRDVEAIDLTGDLPDVVPHPLPEPPPEEPDDLDAAVIGATTPAPTPWTPPDPPIPTVPSGEVAALTDVPDVIADWAATRSGLHRIPLTPLQGLPSVAPEGEPTPPALEPRRFVPTLLVAMSVIGLIVASWLAWQMMRAGRLESPPQPTPDALSHLRPPAVQGGGPDEPPAPVAGEPPGLVQPSDPGAGVAVSGAPSEPAPPAASPEAAANAGDPAVPSAAGSPTPTTGLGSPASNGALNSNAAALDATPAAGEASGAAGPGAVQTAPQNPPVPDPAVPAGSADGSANDSPGRAALRNALGTSRQASGVAGAAERQRANQP